MWWQRYLDGPVPYKSKGRDMSGCDCWGLLRLVYRDVLGIELPSYVEEYERADDRAGAAQAISLHIHEWDVVSPSRAKEGDAVAMTIGGHVCHVGVVTVPGRMLHITRGINASHESYKSICWAKRVEGIYRCQA